MLYVWVIELIYLLVLSILMAKLVVDLLFLSFY